MRESSISDPVHERGRQEVVLAREVAVHRAHGHVGAGGDVAHLDRLVAAFEPQRHRSVDHALAPGLLPAGERAGHRLHPDSVSAPSPGSSGTGPLRWPSMPGQRPGRAAAVVPLDARVGPVATTDGRVPGERGRQTRERLLNATVELLTTTSWRSVKVTDIARRARTSPATFYQYFGNVEHAINVLAEGMVDQAAQLAELVGGDWSEERSWDTARRSPKASSPTGRTTAPSSRVVDLATEEGDAQLRGVRVRALNAVTVALAQVICAASPSAEGGPAARRARRRAPTPWPWRGRWWPCSPACRPTATASNIFGGIRTGPSHRLPGPHAALGRDRPGGAHGPDPAAGGDEAAHLAGARWRRAATAARRYLRATGLSGEPSPPVRGSGVASSRNV